MASKINWHGDKVKQAVNSKAVQNIERACIFVENEVKKAISIGSNKGATPSAPGEPPHKDTGRLRASISHQVDATNLKGRVGTNVKYGKFLELGTKRMKKRPFLVPTVAKNQTRIRQILKGGGK